MRDDISTPTTDDDGSDTSDRRLRAMADAAPALVWENDDSGAIFVNRHYLDFFGATFDDVCGMGWQQFVHPDDLSDYAGHYLEAFAARRPFSHEVRLRRADGEYRWVRSTGQPFGKDRFVGVCLDITEQRESRERLRENEQRTRLLLAELQHRVRNTLAVVRSIARRTAERSAGIEEMMSHFEGRLNAFSRIQAAVTRSPGVGVDLKSIVEDELVAVATREGNQLRIRGPGLQLRSRAAESISLAIHELATNAVKYGALAADHGRIHVQWKVVRNGEAEKLHLEWRETGLDTPPSMSHEGFGHEMLLRSLPYDLGAETNIEVNAGGMRFTMNLPLGPDILAEAGE